MSLADYTIIPCECPRCHTITRVHTYTANWIAYQTGALAQDAFPDLNATEREAVISGLCPECQNLFFGFCEEEEEEEEEEE